MDIPGTKLFSPQVHRDERGTFSEWFRRDACPMPVAQANISMSRKGAIRGIHYADASHGQGKYVSCAHGAVLDVVVDLRAGFPTFGQWASTVLDAEHGLALYIAPGLGHAYLALTDDSVLLYLYAAPHDPQREHAVYPLDPAIGITWPLARHFLSTRDRGALTLAEALDAGELPDYADCGGVP